MFHGHTKKSEIFFPRPPVQYFEAISVLYVRIKNLANQHTNSHLLMKNESWDKHVMDGLLAVNKNLHKGGLLPEKAQRMLYGLEDCLCSGDGLSPQTAFRAQDERVAEKAMELLGMDRQGQPERKGTISQVPVDENPYGVQALYFSIVG